ncbi:Zinc finger protein [Actinidia chinensis var. chinensis]|uniref:Zinc finger protein n=1 Tax=Actinidia chinensis var. chinensis TaxID=1590841 RepID=A0A2R6PEV2_ACTCC|nr:Zinc finger protein [Actinidia chinensis var. chinensis]
MESSAEEFIAFNDHFPVLKGKRTKRQRPISNSNSNGGSGCDSGGSGRDVVYFSIPSPTSSGEISTSADADADTDEDMANCLILLAQGLSPPPAEADEGKIVKFTSRRIAAAGKSGFYVYECKTCNRSFSSFQALGGHRASHKRPKTEAKPPIPPPPQTDVEEKCELTKIPPPLPLPVAPRPNKIHECSICGSEFSSGQALGGHMRRHRSAPTPRTAASFESDDHDEKKRIILPLDLNLPAPLDQDDLPKDSKYQFVFNGPALVDCHY